MSTDSHPRIVIEQKANRVIVRAGCHVVADTVRGLALAETSYPEVLYIPREDVDLALLERTEVTTRCPYKGEASYFSIPSAGFGSANVVWSYETPSPDVAAIAGHIAFHQGCLIKIEEQPAYHWHSAE